MQPDLVSNFERKVLFKIARWVALTICMILVLGLIGSGLYAIFGQTEESEAPNSEEVVNALVEEKKTQTPGVQAGDLVLPSKILKGLRLDPSIQQLMATRQNQQWLYQSLDALPEDHRQACVDGMAATIATGRAHGIDDATLANAYMQQCTQYSTEMAAAKSANTMLRVYMVGVFFAALGLIALFSLVLVLLSIERNTRPQPQRNSP